MYPENAASDNESIALIREICEYGMRLVKNVILDGILDRWKYEVMLSTLIKNWGAGVHVYYYDVPLEITRERHDM